MCFNAVIFARLDNGWHDAALFAKIVLIQSLLCSILLPHKIGACFWAVNELHSLLCASWQPGFCGFCISTTSICSRFLTIILTLLWHWLPKAPLLRDLVNCQPIVDSRILKLHLNNPPSPKLRLLLLSAGSSSFATTTLLSKVNGKTKWTNIIDI